MLQFVCMCCERVYLCVHKDRALPIAVKTSSVRSQLRLCNKLSELLLQLGQCSEAIEYTQTALDISLSLGRLTRAQTQAQSSTLQFCKFNLYNVMCIFITVWQHFPHKPCYVELWLLL